MRVAVAGGTGVVGRQVVAALADGGHEPVVLARSVGVDLVSGVGLDAALAGAGAVVDVSNVAALRRSTASRFFEAATSNLLAAGRRAGIGHHVLLSIVGVDRVGLGYYQAKARQEEMVLGGPVPATVLRATQFHEFAAQSIERGGPLLVVPRMLCQPVAAREVAGELVRLVLEPAAGLAVELAGPQPERLPDMVRRLLRAAGRRRRVLAVRLPGRVGDGMAGGGLLPDGAGRRGEQTFQQWLSSPDSARFLGPARPSR